MIIMAEVYLNGKYVGDVEDPKDFSEQVVSERRKGNISKNIK